MDVAPSLTEIVHVEDVKGSCSTRKPPNPSAWPTLVESTAPSLALTQVLRTILPTTYASTSCTFETMAGLGAPRTTQEMKEATTYLAWRFARVNVNDAAEEHIREVLEISAVEAPAIVEVRTHEGDFHRLEDLKEVPGLEYQKVPKHADRDHLPGRS